MSEFTELIIHVIYSSVLDKIKISPPRNPENMDWEKIALERIEIRKSLEEMELKIKNGIPIPQAVQEMESRLAEKFDQVRLGRATVISLEYS